MGIFGLFKKKTSAQAYMNESSKKNATSACGTACGAGDKEPDEKPSACGTACGAGDKEPEKKPSACGTACGAGEK
jgi:ACGX-repeat protein